MDRLVWNRAEELLKSAESDVLQIFDWYSILPYYQSSLPLLTHKYSCYAGTLGLTRGEYR